ncbi:MAG TPA: LacI family DNA-binding transcriptional regulator [Ktedonobacterales bacterium]
MASTINDIARLAGVSKATVSRVINQKPDVDPETRARILRIMDEQGFTPSIAAAGLAGGRTRLIGVLIPSLTWPLMPEIMRGIGEIVEQSAYELVVYSVSHEHDRSSVIDRILAAKLNEGLLAVYPGQATSYLSKLHESGYPVVMLDDQVEPTGATPWVGADNRLGAYSAVRHLLSLGHRRIGHIKGRAGYLCSDDRYLGYCDALAEAGIPLDPSLVVQGDFLVSGGETCAHELFALSERPTAIFAASDDMASGVLRAAESAGLRVPHDVALVGFDDTMPASFMRPTLTTVRQPFFEMGKRATTLLLDAVNALRQPTPPSWHTAQRASVPIREFLSTQLVVRESCGANRVASFSARAGATG